MTPQKILGLVLLCLGLTAPTYAQYTHNGNANPLGSSCYRLTQAQNGQAGSVWYNSLINLNESFDLYFTIYLGTQDATGADGMAFVLQNENTSIGSSGGGMGYQGITPSLAVEFDTWPNNQPGGINGPNFGDPAGDHIALQRNGDLDHNGPNNLAGPFSILANGGNIEDGTYHDLRIS